MDRNDFYSSYLSLRSKRFQSSYSAKVRAGAKKKTLKGEGEGRRRNASLPSPSPVIPLFFFLLSSQLSRRLARKRLLCRLVLPKKIPSWSVMLSIHREALHFDSKELQAFRESSVARKWRKHAIAAIMLA